LVGLLVADQAQQISVLVAALAIRLREAVGSFPQGVVIRYSPSFHGTARRDGTPSADILARKAAGLGERRWAPSRRRS
ncbi:MAG TPA: hypothetical protein VIZ68_05220, partial [Thermoplasmata archaeon]